MKPLCLLFAVSLLSYSSCKKPHYPPPVTATYHTGWIVNAMCGNIIIQFTDGSPLGQNNWVDAGSTSGASYNHVFRVGNPCTWGGGEAGQTIRFKFVEPQVQTCALCMAYIPTPDTTYNIQVIP